MLRIFQVLIFVICPILLSAQSVDRQVVGAFGGSTEIDSVYLNSSLGELNVNYYAGDFYVQQGFIQAEDWVFVSIEEEHEDRAIVSLYPNPSANQFTIDVSRAGRSHDVVQVFDINGTLIHWEQAGTQQRIVVDAIEWASGIYFVRLTSPEGKTHTVKFQKI